MIVSPKGNINFGAVEKLKTFYQIIVSLRMTQFMNRQKGTGDVQKGALSKAAGALARGAYS